MERSRLRHQHIAGRRAESSPLRPCQVSWTELVPRWSSCPGWSGSGAQAPTLTEGHLTRPGPHPCAHVSVANSQNHLVGGCSKLSKRRSDEKYTQGHRGTKPELGFQPGLPSARVCVRYRASHPNTDHGTQNVLCKSLFNE